jgi:hypothetical protein
LQQPDATLAATLRFSHMFRLFSRALLLLCAILVASAVQAQTRIFVSCPTGVPCSTGIFGHIDAVGTARLAWIVQMPAPANQCLRLINVGSDASVLMTVIAPDGIVYRASDNLFVNPVLISGWYTVQLDTAPPGIEQIFELQLFLFDRSDCAGSTQGR